MTEAVPVGLSSVRFLSFTFPSSREASARSLLTPLGRDEGNGKDMRVRVLSPISLLRAYDSTFGSSYLVPFLTLTSPHTVPCPFRRVAGSGKDGTVWEVQKASVPVPTHSTSCHRSLPPHVVSLATLVPLLRSDRREWSGLRDVRNDKTRHDRRE